MMSSILLVALSEGLFSFFSWLIAIIVIVFVHEFGHFYVGRLCGVTIETFSVGFGKEIFGFYDKYGTRWKFSWIPLGGYVKFVGDANAASFPSDGAAAIPGSLHAAKLWKRMAIVVAGPVANFLLTIFILASFFTLIGVTVVPPKVGMVVKDSPAMAAGLMQGDIVRKIDGQIIGDFNDIRHSMVLHGEQPVALEIERGGEMINLSITPKFVEVDDGFKGKIRVTQMGIGPPEGTNVRLGLLPALSKSVQDTYFLAKTTLRFVGKIFLGSESAKDLRGPIGTVEIAGAFAKTGAVGLIEFIALISVSIGLINLFPIPMLDGGHLMFYAIEGLIGKPVSQKTQEWSLRIGLSLILMLMIFVTFNDLGRFAALGFGT